MFDMYQIGEILKIIREENAYQLTTVQERTGIDYSQLSRIENGKRLPTTEHIEKLSLLYGVDKSVLMAHRDSDKILSSIESSDVAKQAIEIAREKLVLGERYLSHVKDDIIPQRIQISGRRYIGSKAKLIDWIFDTISNNVSDAKSFCDIFAGTGVVAATAFEHFQTIIVNDLLYSNNVIYKAFFGSGHWDQPKLNHIIDEYNALDPTKIQDNYFSENYGNKYFELSEARKIGYIRQHIEDNKESLSDKEYSILLASLIYSMDKIANTIGHYEAYIKKSIPHRPLVMKLVDVHSFDNVQIFREDANKLARRIDCDVVYIDPPYNSRQYSRFYHVYETLVKWDKPALFGVAMKPTPENMSAYCSNKAANAMRDLVTSLKSKYVVVSYNNTYNSKSSSSENKITIEELTDILQSVGDTRIFEHKHKAFNAGKTDFKDHKEFLFITKKHE